MITEKYIQERLEAFNVRRFNIRHCRTLLIDSEREIIEALTLPAPTYSDKIQAPKSETITAILERIPIELRKQRYEASYTAAINEAKSLEMDHLLYAISCLDDEVQHIIRRRYIDQVKGVDLARETDYSTDKITRLSRKGIRYITAIFNQRGAEPIVDAV